MNSSFHAREIESPDTFVKVQGLTKTFPVRSGLIRRSSMTAISEVTFAIRKGETLGMVGESGSGKTTIGRTVVGLIPPTAGTVTVGGELVDAANHRAQRALWRRTQMIFQNPYSSLNPRLTVAETLREPLRSFGIARGADAELRIRKTIDACGLPASALDRYPREFSGGQRQRIGIARALIVEPEFVVADEPVSALDVSIQAQVINLLRDLQVEHGLTYLFIGHDLAVVQHVSDRIAVMFHGHLVELCSKKSLFTRARHPYTQLLVRSVPIPDPVLERERRTAMQEAPQAASEALPTGCPFVQRCPNALLPRCTATKPALREVEDGHFTACHLVESPSSSVPNSLSHLCRRPQ